MAVERLGQGLVEIPALHRLLLGSGVLREFLDTGELTMGARILLVEDEPSIADNVRYALETEGFVVEWSATIEGARRAWASSAVDLVVLDVNLPDGSGFEFCKELRSASEVPVIFLTSRTSEIDRVVGLEIGGDDYVVKPFSPRELSARVKNLLRRANGGAAPVAAVGGCAGGLVIDDEKKQARVGGVLLDLARYEYGLVKTLVGRPGRVFSREELMSRVWEEPESIFDRTVDAHIKNLRTKIKAAGGDPSMIATHRGMGYSFREGAGA